MFIILLCGFLKGGFSPILLQEKSSGYVSLLEFCPIIYTNRKSIFIFSRNQIFQCHLSFMVWDRIYFPLLSPFSSLELV